MAKNKNKSKVKTTKIKLSDFSLESSWTSSGGKITQSPTSASKAMDAEFTYSSGTKISSVKFYATASPSDIKGTLTVNGSGKKSVNNGVFTFDLGKKFKSGSENIKVEFVAFGDKSNSGTQTISFTKVYVEIKYKNGSVKVAKLQSTATVAPPPSTIYIYQSTKKELYVFDGVTQIQHNNTVTIEESPDKSKADKYINNAKNEPDKLVVDVVMSDIYSSGEADDSDKFKFKGNSKSARKKAEEKIPGSSSAISRGLNSRSSGMFRVLLALKESRAAVVVITPQNIYTDMLVSSVTANQNSEHQFGWEGQITFQGNAYVNVTKKTVAGKKTTVQAPSESLLWNLGIRMPS